MAEHKTDIVTRLQWRRQMVDHGHGNVTDEPDDDCEEAAKLIETLRGTASCDAKKAFHRYGDQDPLPKGIRLASSVSVVRCECGMICIRFHKPTTFTHPGPVFAAAFLDRKTCAEIGDDILASIDLCRHNVPCDGKHS
jgi:hypothetical protein